MMVMFYTQPLHVHDRVVREKVSLLRCAGALALALVPSLSALCLSLSLMPQRTQTAWTLGRRRRASGVRTKLRLPAYYFRELTGTPEPTDTTERTFTPPAASDLIRLDRLGDDGARTEHAALDENGRTRSLRQLLR